MERTILHCDCNGFYASVECVRRPELKKVPMAVCGNPEHRHGIILAKNELAKSYGVITAETIWQAKKKCPELVLVPPHHDDYRRYSERVNAIYEEYTDQVEPFGIDESWLDVTGSRTLFGDGVTIANILRKRVYEDTGLTISVGVSFNKIFAKLGSDYKKPDATTVISKDNYEQIVHPLPVTSLLFIGKAATATLHKFGIHTIGDLAHSSKEQLRYALGKTGESIWEHANGLDQSPVRTVSQQREIKSISHGTTFHRNLLGMDDIKIGVRTLSDKVAARLRKHGLFCGGVQVVIKDPQFKVISRQRQLEHPTDLAETIYRCVLEMIRSSWDLSKSIRLITIAGINLTDQPSGYQLNLLSPNEPEKNEKREHLEHALDHIREKYGWVAVQNANLLRQDITTNDEREHSDADIEEKPEP